MPTNSSLNSHTLVISCRTDKNRQSVKKLIDEINNNPDVFNVLDSTISISELYKLCSEPEANSSRSIEPIFRRVMNSPLSSEYLYLSNISTFIIFKYAAYIAKLRIIGNSDLINDNLNKNCCICLGDYEDNDEIILLPCSHFIHTSCLKHSMGNITKCPVCRAKLNYQ